MDPRPGCIGSVRVPNVGPSVSQITRSTRDPDLSKTIETVGRTHWGRRRDHFEGRETKCGRGVPRGRDVRN